MVEPESLPGRSKLGSPSLQRISLRWNSGSVASLSSASYSGYRSFLHPLSSALAGSPLLSASSALLSWALLSAMGSEVKGAGSACGKRVQLEMGCSGGGAGGLSWFSESESSVLIDVSASESMSAAAYCSSSKPRGIVL